MSSSDPTTETPLVRPTRLDVTGFKTEHTRSTSPVVPYTRGLSKSPPSVGETSNRRTSQTTHFVVGLDVDEVGAAGRGPGSREGVGAVRHTRGPTSASETSCGRVAPVPVTPAYAQGQVGVLQDRTPRGRVGPPQSGAQIPQGKDWRRDTRNSGRRGTASESGTPFKDEYQPKRPPSD